MNSIAKVTLLSLCTLSFSGVASSKCSNLSGCEKKFCEIEYQIEQTNNQHKIDGLTIALKESKVNCSDGNLKRDLLDKIRDSEEDLAEYKSDLEEAKESGKESKVQKYQEKIEEELSDLDDLSMELQELQQLN